jgi:hypothetical protein
MSDENLKAVNKENKEGIGGMFLISSILLCLLVGFGGGIYRSCDVVFDSSDDRAICYYRSATNKSFFSEESSVVETVTKPTEPDKKEGEK